MRKKDAFWGGNGREREGGKERERVCVCEREVVEKRTDLSQMGVVRPIEKKLLFRVLTEFSSLLKCPEKKKEKSCRKR